MKDVRNRLVSKIDPELLVRPFLSKFTFVKREVTGFGMVYLYDRPSHAGKWSIQIALYGNLATAHAAVHDQAMLVSVPTAKIDKPIGDEALVWKGADPNGGAILFRRDNAVIYLSGGLPFDQKLKLAERLDTAIDNDEPGVERKTSLVLPEIEKIDLPPSVKAGHIVTAEIKFKGVDAAKVLLGTENANVIVRQGPPATMTYHAPKKPGRDQIVIVIGTPGNLLSKTFINIDVR